MTSFSRRIAARDPRAPVMANGAGETLTPGTLAGALLADTLGPRPRLALSIGDPAALLRALSAADGRAEAIVLLSAGLPRVDVELLARQARCTTILSDRTDLPGALAVADAITDGGAPGGDVATEWIMTTSGTTGLPKLVRHTLATLTRTVRTHGGGTAVPAWGLLYEATRFAGLQVVLQATLGGNLLVAPDPSLDFGERLAMLARAGCTHLSATPTLWRRMLMHPAAAALPLRQVTLGGEIADQAVLDALRARFPHAQITHIYASTEAGVGFSVKDGYEGFPRTYLSDGAGDVRLKLVDGRLWLRAPGAVVDYLGDGRVNRDREGYVDTEDGVELAGDRVLFLGRATGAVNVGGAKVHPETVERVLAAMPSVAMAKVVARRNPISGSILVAQVVPAEPVEDEAPFKREIIRRCRHALPAEAVPALVQLREDLDVTAAGKLART